ncbi:MAG: hypothetical protein WCR42_01955 [bacterium]
MKIINLISIILLCILLNSCKFTIIDGEILNLSNFKIRERVIRFPLNDTTQIMLRNDKDIRKYTSRSIAERSKINFIYYSFGDSSEITDYINDFPNLSEIYFNWPYASINISETPKNLKSIIISSTEPPIKNITSLKNIERIVFTEAFDNDNYYSNILKDFPNLMDLTLDIPTKYFSIPKNVIALNNLEKLTINRTKFKKIPSEICKMKGLKELTIESDRFLKVPDCIFKMDSLRVITMIGTDKDVAKFYEKYKDKNQRIQIKTIGGKEYY